MFLHACPKAHLWPPQCTSLYKQLLQTGIGVRMSSCARCYGSMIQTRLKAQEGTLEVNASTACCSGHCVLKHPSCHVRYSAQTGAPHIHQLGTQICPGAVIQLPMHAGLKCCMHGQLENITTQHGISTTLYHHHALAGGCASWWWLGAASRPYHHRQHVTVPRECAHDVAQGHRRPGHLRRRPHLSGTPAPVACPPQHTHTHTHAAAGAHSNVCP